MNSVLIVGKIEKKVVNGENPAKGQLTIKGKTTGVNRYGGQFTLHTTYFCQTYGQSTEALSTVSSGDIVAVQAVYQTYKKSDGTYGHGFDVRSIMPIIKYGEQPAAAPVSYHAPDAQTEEDELPF
jgi:hypothetical protein